MVLTDVHGNVRRALKLSQEAERLKPDLVVLCGDLTHFGTLEDAETVLKCFRGFKTIYVPGNCDPPALLDIEELSDALNIHGKLHIHDSVGFLGVGGALEGPFKTPIEFTEDHVARLLEKAFKGFDGRLIVVSHNPPWNTRVDRTFIGIHIGSKALRRFIEKVKPLAVLCGHVHEARGIDRLSETVIVNPGPARNGFYAFLDVDGGVKINLNRV
ncbi:hypothetical protein DRO57_02460 [Candidatus Bathyarchaeota archaeon]|nr:MAG: hypothetical protein DRO57_02460 [Candidatus Bathyarchaeota archaeon]